MPRRTSATAWEVRAEREIALAYATHSLAALPLRQLAATALATAWLVDELARETPERFADWSRQERSQRVIVRRSGRGAIPRLLKTKQI